MGELNCLKLVAESNMFETECSIRKRKCLNVKFADINLVAPHFDGKNYGISGANLNKLLIICSFILSCFVAIFIDFL